MRAHSDQEIIERASAEEKNPKDIQNNSINITVDMDDEHGTAHTYVVNFSKDKEGNWKPVEVSELSSL